MKTFTANIEWKSDLRTISEKSGIPIDELKTTTETIAHFEEWNPSMAKISTTYWIKRHKWLAKALGARLGGRWGALRRPNLVLVHFRAYERGTVYITPPAPKIAAQDRRHSDTFIKNFKEVNKTVNEMNEYEYNDE